MRNRRNPKVGRPKCSTIATTVKLCQAPDGCATGRWRRIVNDHTIVQVRKIASERLCRFSVAMKSPHCVIETGDECANLTDFFALSVGNDGDLQLQAPMRASRITKEPWGRGAP